MSDQPRVPVSAMLHCVSQRRDEVIGTHRVRFFANEECIELGHVAQDRDIYARGAIEAGLWLLDQPAGLYSATDWLAE